MSDPFIIVTPVYEDKESAMRLLLELEAVFGKNVYVILVDDGSKREPVDLSWMMNAGINGMIITLRRNFGHQKAIATGLCYVAEHIPDKHLVIMDADGEDRPKSIKTLLNTNIQNEDVIVAQRRIRVEKYWFKFFYEVYKILFKILTGRTINFGNFALYTPAAVAKLSKVKELWIHVAASILYIKLNIYYEPIDRGRRYAGNSKMNFISLVLHGCRSFIVFANNILFRGGVCWLLLVGVSLAAGLIVPNWYFHFIGMLMLVILPLGILMLLLTGFMKSLPNIPPDYRSFVKEIRKT